MNIKQQNLKPVERTLCVSGLLGRSGQSEQAGRGYLDMGIWLDTDHAAGGLGMFGIPACSPANSPVKATA